MPRVVRNFWIEGSTDNGTRFGTGPRSKEDGFEATVYQRTAGGGIATALRIRGFATRDGKLRLEVERVKDSVGTCLVMGNSDEWIIGSER